MSLEIRRMEEEEVDWLFEIVLKGLNVNAELDQLRNVVNCAIPVQKYRLLNRFLSSKVNISIELLLRCLPIFLDERTKFLSFEHIIFDQENVKFILEIISRYCPNIQIVDIRNLWITRRENLETFLKQTPQLKSIRVKCYNGVCAIHQLLLEEDFNRLDEEVKIGLLKIEYIDGWGLNGPKCARLLKLLPNLKGLGMYQDLNVVFPLITGDDDDEIPQKLSKITEYCGRDTTLTTLECFLRFCPNITKIYLSSPGENVMENLWRFPLLEEIELFSFDEVYFVRRLNNLIKLIGKRIKILTLKYYGEIGFDPFDLQVLCPKLSKLKYNNTTKYY